MSGGVGRRCGSDPVLLWRWHKAAASSSDSIPRPGNVHVPREDKKEKKKNDSGPKGSFRKERRNKYLVIQGENEMPAV